MVGRATLAIAPSSTAITRAMNTVSMAQYPLRHRETIWRRHLPASLAGFAAVPKSATRFDGGAAMPA